jgi:hypothetical protein
MIAIQTKLKDFKCNFFFMLMNIFIVLTKHTFLLHTFFLKKKHVMILKTHFKRIY